MENKAIQWNSIENETSINLEHNTTKGFKNFKDKKIHITIFIAFLVTLLQFLTIKSCTSSSGHSSSGKYAVVVASQDIAKGETMNDENTKLAYLDVGESRGNYILNSEFKKYNGHKIRVNLSKDSPFIKDVVVKNSADMSIPEKIPPGKRFYVVDVDLSSMASMIKVGDRVDIIAHMQINGFGKATETILNAIKIIGIGDDFQESSSNSSGTNLSFYLTPEEVKIISFMKSYSQFTVALRNPNDIAIAESDSITFNKFIQNEKIQKIFENDSFKIVQGKTRQR